VCRLSCLPPLPATFLPLSTNSHHYLLPSHHYLRLLATFLRLPATFPPLPAASHRKKWWYNSNGCKEKMITRQERYHRRKAGKGRKLRQRAHFLQRSRSSSISPSILHLGADRSKCPTRAFSSFNSARTVRRPRAFLAISGEAGSLTSSYVPQPKTDVELARTNYPVLVDFRRCLA
jgi:hypothetical protein